jgi:AbiV family abortive infection protein
MASFATAQTLLQGAWYALEQAGQLLDSAVTLIDADKFSTATGVAMLGREELGRYKILRKLADDVAKGRVMSVDDVQAACDDHEDKQKAAQLSSTMRTQQGTRLGDALRMRHHEAPRSDAWREAGDVLQGATDATIKRTPADRHRLRMQSFYVDLQTNGASWNRPREIPVQKARDEVTNAVNDYAVQRDRLLGIAVDPEMTSALNTINPTPHLAIPRWPSKLI